MRIIAAVLFFAVLLPQTAGAVDIREATKQLQQAELRWTRASPSRYLLEVRYSTFLLTYGCELQTFRVSGRRSTPTAPPSCKSQPRKLGSVPALFRLVHKLLAQRPDEIAVEYDATYGYPKTFYAGSNKVEDNFFKFTVIEFKAIDR